MDGLLIIDKPAGLTSHDVVNRVRRIFDTRRVGHTGTLDPFATGVLVVLIGRATRLAEFLDKDEKEYEAMVRFGFETDSGDRTGSPKPQVSSPKSLAVDDVEKVLPAFRGEIEQVPTMFSAKKVAGKKLYEYARKGDVIERKAVTVTVSRLEVAGEITKDLKLATWDVGLNVVCSAGTYVRTLAEDIGREVGVGAHLGELRRTRAGRFDLSHGITLDELEKLEDPSGALIKMAAAVEHLPPITLSAERVEKTRNGLSTRVEEADFADGQAVCMLAETDDLVAVGIYDAEEHFVRPKVVLV